NCALWVTYNGGDGTLFSCSIQDSMHLTATLCDSARQLHFLRNPHPGDSVSVLRAGFLDSSQAVVRLQAAGFDSLPQLRFVMGGGDSMGFILHWKPRLLSDSVLTIYAAIRFVTYDIKTG